MYATVWLEEATRQYDKDWTYEVPENLQAVLEPGSLVEVPFGAKAKPVRGVVSATMAEFEPDSDFIVRAISRLLLPRPQVTGELLKLAAEMRRRYFCSRGRAIKTMVPSTVTDVGDLTGKGAYLTNPVLAEEMLSTGEFNSINHVRVVEFLLVNEKATLNEIRQAAGVSNSVLQTLKKNKVLTYCTVQIERNAPRETEDAVPDVSVPKPTIDQKKALDALYKAFQEKKKGQLSEFLLEGITGSGKTEVYLQTASRVLASGRDVLILVPEIALTPLMVSRVTQRFGDDVAIIHSRMTAMQRYETWQSILKGKAHIVVGARSAVFAPLRNLGLIVVDEEQESSYKSEMSPRYHARDIARMRAMLSGAILVLGSATPSVETRYRAEEGKSVRLPLPRRTGSALLPAVKLIDMRRERAVGNKGIFSHGLTLALTEVFRRGEQAMLLLNRRGYAGRALCHDCGYVMRCDDCDVAYTRHQNLWHQGGYPERQRDRLICHYCGKIVPLPRVCPVCRSKNLAFFGFGTQQLEEQFKELFPEVKSLRMDMDTTTGRFSHKDLLDAFAKREYGCLIGTQMIAKGHDFKNVTLVGIVDADQILAQSDYRSGERAFQLMTQAAGRAGRGDLSGEVIIQTWQPDDAIIRAAAQHDYDVFYNREIEYRRRAGYAPFGHIGMILVTGEDREITAENTDKLADYLQGFISRYGGDFAETVLLGAQPAPISRIRKRYRYRIVVKARTVRALTLLLREADSFKIPRGLYLGMDIDPYGML